jgi:hypothetical protein
MEPCGKLWDEMDWDERVKVVRKIHPTWTKCHFDLYEAMFSNWEYIQDRIKKQLRKVLENL